MSRSKGNWDYNYPKVIKYLESEGIQYEEYNDGQHLKIMGATSLVELWPSRMTYHIIQSENPSDTHYHKLSFYFKEQELERVLSQ